MGEENRVADYFVVVGLPDQPEPLTDLSDRSHLKSMTSMEPITDITVIFPSLDEKCPEGYNVLLKTPTGGLADLNHGSLNSPEVYICYRRGRDKPPLVDIGVLFEKQERVLDDVSIVETTPYGRLANVNNTAAKTFLTYRRAPKDMPANELVVTDICVINESKFERPPHAFCQIRKNLNKAMFSSAMYLCYKKSVHRANVVSYKPALLCRYPVQDRPEWSLPPAVPLFCMPMGASIELWPPQASQPSLLVSTFVLTVSDAAEKVYGSAVTFYESCPLEQLTNEQIQALKPSVILRDKKFDKTIDHIQEFIAAGYTININKCICILSHWPFFECFRKFLYFLYTQSQNVVTSPSQNEKSHVPIERYISHFIKNVPLPTPQIPRIQVQLSLNFENFIDFTLLEDLPLPRSGADFLDLVTTLSVDDILLILFLVLTEHKMLVHSLRANVLTSVVEAISMMVYPFKWQCPYIPLCPLGLAEVLHAPLPFLIGVDSRFFDLYEPPPDVICVDLDTNLITMPEDRRHLTYKFLPKRPSKILRFHLESIAGKIADLGKIKPSSKDEYQSTKNEQRLELDVREAFLRFMASILKGYRNFLKPITKAPTIGTTDTNSLFDLQGFIKSRDRNHLKFYQMLSLTQMFIRFIEERSFLSDVDAGLTFFDDCTDKEDIEDFHVRLLEIEESHKSERTAVIVPPEPVLGNQKYDGIFELNAELFDPLPVINTLQVPPSPYAKVGKLANGPEGWGAAPGSPMARRSKHEVKSAKKLAKSQRKRAGPYWARCLLTTCYSIWFIQLPSYILSDIEKASYYLSIAYDILVKLHELKLHPTDEVCYRVMMQLCGIHGQPATAVKLLFLMRRSGLQPNALTYGYYNRAVLEAKWPQEMQNSGRVHWKKLRNVILGVAQFRRSHDDKGVSGVRGSKSKLDGSTTSIPCLGERQSAFETSSQFVTSLKSNLVYTVDLRTHELMHGPAGILMPAEGKLNEEQTSKFRRKSCTEFAALMRQTTVGINPKLVEVPAKKILQRSESFASDFLILEKHNQLRKDTELNKTPRKALSITRESSESLDQSVDGDSIKDREETPSRKLWKKSSKFMSDLSDLLRASQDSVQSDASLHDDAVGKRRLNGRSSWTSQEALSSERIRANDRAASESAEVSFGMIGMRTSTFGDSDESLSQSYQSPVNTSLDSRETSEDRSCRSSASPKKLSVDNDLEESYNEYENERTITNSIEARNLLNQTNGWKKTFLENLSMLSPSFKSEQEQNMQRSSTLPITSAVALPSVISSPSLNFPCSLKLSFSRMGSGRYLRKGDLKFSKTLGNAFSGPKSTEIISSVKSAASLVAKKFEEVISTNTTPIKSLNQSSDFSPDEIGDGTRLESRTNATALEGASWGSNIKRELFGDESRKGSALSLDELSQDRLVHDTLYGKRSKSSRMEKTAVTIMMTTCSRCTFCSAILHDEEIAAGWTWDDSNLNTQCHFCGKATLPFLTVTICDYRGCAKDANQPGLPTLGKCLGSISDLKMDPSGAESTKMLEPVIVPYLNPLVLRKELENILQNKGDPNLVQPSFVDEHPIVYWNLVWVFERIAVPSHLANLVLESEILSKEQIINPSAEDDRDQLNVAVVCLWNNPRLLEEIGLPLYILRQQREQPSTLCDALIDKNSISLKVIESIVSHLKSLQVKDALRLLLRERQRQSKRSRCRSSYRELLDLYLVDCCRSMVDLEQFDREYKKAFKALLDEGETLNRFDKPPVSASFRNYFLPLVM